VLNPQKAVICMQMLFFSMERELVNNSDQVLKQCNYQEAHFKESRAAVWGFHVCCMAVF